MIEAARHWMVGPPAPPELLASFPGLSPIVLQVLYNRGVADPEAVAGFLAESPPPTADPMLMDGMAAAVARLARAARAGESIAVYGDFDVDGVTASALLAEAFAAVGIEAEVYLPTRAEGYGLHAPALIALAERGIGLVVTVDCGTNSFAEVALANEAGVDVIVTDHHRVDGPSPDAVAVINPRLARCAYPFKDLAAVGVAFKLAQATLRHLPLVAGHTRGGVASRLLDLIALGTVADVAPLLGENRALVRRGLGTLNRAPRPGLRALMAVAGLRPGAITSGSIGYALAPRLNAAGRLHDASAAYSLLLAKENAEAKVLAATLDSANQERQRLMNTALERARDRLLAETALPKLLFVADAEVPAGIAGLVAGRLAEQFYRPAVVVQLADGECRGSARSIDGFNVAEALASCRDLLSRFGGHPQAAGFTVPSASLPELHRRLVSLATQQLGDALLRRRLLVDAEVPLPVLSGDLHEQLCGLAPFGNGNPAPVFLTRGARVVSSRVVGREQPGHLKLQLHDGERYWPAIAFGGGRAIGHLAHRIDIVYTLELNTWEGQSSLELHVKDWRPTL